MAKWGIPKKFVLKTYQFVKRSVMLGTKIFIQAKMNIFLVIQKHKSWKNIVTQHKKFEMKTSWDFFRLSSSWTETKTKSFESRDRITIWTSFMMIANHMLVSDSHHRILVDSWKNINTIRLNKVLRMFEPLTYNFKKITLDWTKGQQFYDTG